MKHALRIAVAAAAGVGTVALVLWGHRLGGAFAFAAGVAGLYAGEWFIDEITTSDRH